MKQSKPTLNITFKVFSHCAISVYLPPISL